MAEIAPRFRWILPDLAPDDTAVLARELDLSELAARLLLRRGLRTTDAAREFLSASPALLHKPATLPDIKAATDRIAAALDNKERICVYGDYDVDGVTGTCLLVSALRRLGADVVYYLPHRESEGYGLSLAGVEFCREQGARVLMTTDCGSTDRESVGAAVSAGIDVIITDHHEVPADAPQPLALVNPKRPDSAYPFSELAGAGVAFKLAWSVLSALGRPREELTDLLDLVGIGTIADMVPLLGENRIIARLGLAAIRDTKRPGLRALIRRSGIKNRALTGYDIGFIIGPRLNAAGRISHASIAAELLLTEDLGRAEELAAVLDGHNRSRQALEEQTYTQAVSLIKSKGMEERRVIVVAEEGWHKGVIGIVASRLVERYFRPCIVVALEGDSGKGSGRSVNGFNLYHSLKACSGLLTGFGGHKYAAGIVIERNRIPDFGDAINRYAEESSPAVHQPTLEIDAVCSLGEIDGDLVGFLRRLEPFGPENRKPVIAALGLEIAGKPCVVGKNHLKLALLSAGAVRQAIAWRRGDELANLPSGEARLDACFTVDQNTYAGRTSIQLTLRDFRTQT